MLVGSDAPETIIQTEEELRQYVLDSFGIEIPDVQVCEHHSTPWRAFCDAYFAYYSVTVWIASRGFGGKSFLLALLGLTEATSLKANVNVLGGSGEQSSRVHDYMQSFWNYSGSPRHLLTHDPTTRETRLVGGNSIKALMASQASVRGPHPQRLRLDEADEMDIKILDAAMGQPMSLHGVRSQTVISSTHHYADGTMTEILKRAADKGWGQYQWCWRESHAGGQGWLPMFEVEEKRHNVTAAMWNVEYELQEPSPESRAIDEASVRLMFDRSLGDFEGGFDELVILEEPVEGGKYANGCDWARKSDYTVQITLRYDVTPMRLVAYRRTRRKPWPVMVNDFETRCKTYPGKASHDGTGLGDVIAGYITVRGIEDFLMVGRARADLLSNYIGAIERQEILSPFIKSMEGEHRLASVDDVYGSGHLPDTISSGALAYRAATVLTQGTTWDDVQNLGHDEDYVNPWR